MHKKIAQSFNKAALKYDEYAVMQRHIGSLLINKIKCLKIKPRRVLDLGCGTGMSTPAYAGAFAVFGMERLCQEMAELSKVQDWDGLEERVDDEVLDTCVIIALYDDLAATIKNRYSDLIERIEVSLPVRTPEDQEQLRDVIRALS